MDIIKWYDGFQYIIYISYVIALLSSYIYYEIHVNINDINTASGYIFNIYLFCLLLTIYFPYSILKLIFKNLNNSYSITEWNNIVSTYIICFYIPLCPITVFEIMISILYFFQKKEYLCNILPNSPATCTIINIILISILIKIFFIIIIILILSCKECNGCNLCDKCNWCNACIYNNNKIHPNNNMNNDDNYSTS